MYVYQIYQLYQSRVNAQDLRIGQFLIFVHFDRVSLNSRDFVRSFFKLIFRRLRLVQ